MVHVKDVEEWEGAAHHSCDADTAGPFIRSRVRPKGRALPVFFAHRDNGDDDEAAGESCAGELGRCQITGREIATSVLGQAGQAPPHVGPAELVGHQERLADHVGGGLAESVLQDRKGPFEVG